MSKRTRVRRLRVFFSDTFFVFRALIVSLAFFFAAGCGMGGDVESRACAFKCALDNRNDVTEALFSCVLDKNCMPEM